MNGRVKRAAKLSGVQEGSVLGLADLVYWREWQRQPDLIPLEHYGKGRVIIITASPVAPVFHALVDSHFVPTEWELREKASHSKSKTCKCRRQ